MDEGRRRASRALRDRAPKRDELPLLSNDAPSPLPTLDSTRLLGHAAVDVALGEAHLPNWRGRPHVERFR